MDQESYNNNHLRKAIKSNDLPGIQKVIAHFKPKKIAKNIYNLIQNSPSKMHILRIVGVHRSFRSCWELLFATQDYKEQIQVILDAAIHMSMYQYHSFLCYSLLDVIIGSYYNQESSFIGDIGFIPEAEYNTQANIPRECILYTLHRIIDIFYEYTYLAEEFSRYYVMRIILYAGQDIELAQKWFFLFRAKDIAVTLLCKSNNIAFLSYILSIYPIHTMNYESKTAIHEICASFINSDESDFPALLDRLELLIGLGGTCTFEDEAQMMIGMGANCSLEDRVRGITSYELAERIENDTIRQKVMSILDRTDNLKEPENY